MTVDTIVNGEGALVYFLEGLSTTTTTSMNKLDDVIFIKRDGVEVCLGKNALNQIVIKTNTSKYHSIDDICYPLVVPLICID